MTGALAARIGAAIDRAIERAPDRRLDPAVSLFAARLAGENDGEAVLFYGSNLRTGSREGVLDFYVLTPGAAETGLWPRVSYREWEHEGETLRAKIATMTLAKFAEAAAGETIDTTIWARFVQPCALVWARDHAARADVAQALEQAARTAARLAVAVGPPEGSEREYWRALFRATYQAELRVEKPGREDSILDANAAHFDGLLTAALAADAIAVAGTGATLTPQLDPARRREILRWWNKRRRLGKPLNILRLIRATGTFDGAARYAAWKVERHTGVPVKLTPFREKYPLLAAPAVALQIWRAKRR